LTYQITFKNATAHPAIPSPKGKLLGAAWPDLGLGVEVVEGWVVVFVEDLGVTVDTPLLVVLVELVEGVVAGLGENIGVGDSVTMTELVIALLPPDVGVR